MEHDSRELRNALGRFATGVCLITTVTQAGQAVGITANSFASVSLEPPLVSWNLQNNSDMYEVFSAPRYFAINILAREQEEHSAQYARKAQHNLHGHHFRLGKYGAPIVRDALVSFECELHATHAAGDHLIVVGRVRDMCQRPTGVPLLFYGGGYRELR